ncbi:hypothetical protein UFOVP43_4 [uncultured Caudovirales phage]|uniref:Uncharacterized protein n=1 Tax=uncultured Caudovirales phage TaxID=2100421 RepID=A0A6J5KQY9_9CAUD|nr:hypothetical protein UFOVP43_4 [uncultured Caudovirales phage]
MTNAASKTTINIVPVQGIFGPQPTFTLVDLIGPAGTPFYPNVNPAQSGLNITNSTIDNSVIGGISPSTGNFTNITTSTGSITSIPVNASDITNKSYVDALAQGLNPKGSVKCATTGDITLSGLQVIDTYTTVAGDRVLVKDQVNQAQNGIYVASASSWTRATDMDVWPEVTGAYTVVVYGSANLDTGWVSTSANTGTVGVTAITFVLFANNSTYFAGTGLSLAAKTFSITNTGVTATSYGSGSSVGTFTVNAQGQLTNASNVAIAIANTQVSGLGTMSTQNANSVAITGGAIDGTTIGATTQSSVRATTIDASNTVTLAPSTTSLIPLHFAVGSQPSAPVQGDTWNETTGLYFHNSAYTNQLNLGANTAGVLDVPVVTVAVGGATISASSVKAVLFSLPGWIGDYKEYVIPAASGLALTDNVANYLVVNYNGGSPVYQIITNPALITNSDIVGASLLWRSGTDVHFQNINWGLSTASRLNRRLVQTDRYQRASGLTLGESTGRVITLTAGVVWYGVSEINELAVTSASSNSDFYYHVAGVDTKSVVSTYNNTQYDDGTGLQTLSNGRYAVNWVYRYLDGAGLPKLAYNLGSGNYTLAQATASSPPAPPAILTSIAILVGRIIVLKSAATATQIDSAFTQVFSSTTVTDHDDLSGLQGGAAAEYFHLTSAEYTGTGTGVFVRATSPTLVTPALGTPSALVGTNITGTAASLSIGGNAATATLATNATNAVNATTSTNLAGGAAGAVPYQSGAGATNFVSPGTTGQVLTSAGTGTPTWTTPTSYATVTDDTTTNATRYPLFASSTAGNLATEYVASTKYQFNPSTGILTATGFAGSGASLTSIPNGALVNSSVTVGSTAIALGASATTIAGLTSVTSTTFVGALTGNASTATTATTATNATNSAITDNTSTNAVYYPTFVSATTGNLPMTVASTKLKFNPSTGAMTASQLIIAP